MEVVKVVEAVKEELEKIEKAVSDQAMESEVCKIATFTSHFLSITLELSQNCIILDDN